MTARGGIVLGCAVAVLGSACGASHPTSPRPAQVSVSGGPTLTGKVVSITAFHGHPVVMIFWASWCGPCHDEQPQLNAAYAKWSSRGVEFLGVDVRDTSAPALAFQSQFKVPYPSIADSNATLAVAYRIPSAPALVFLTTHGTVGEVVLGGLGTMSIADFDTEIATLLPGSQTGTA